jgi:Fe-S-cluster containining protein
MATIPTRELPVVKNHKLSILKDHSKLSDAPWYQEGLRFKCTGCGKCCTGSPGYVWIEDTEIDRIAALLKISLQEFIRRYTRLVSGRLSLNENQISYDCIFLKDKKYCQVYEARPKQCQTFPWWDGLLKNPESWEAAGLDCEGINHPEAPLVPFYKIEEERCK